MLEWDEGSVTAVESIPGWEFRWRLRREDAKCKVYIGSICDTAPVEKFKEVLFRVAETSVSRWCRMQVASRGSLGRPR